MKRILITLLILFTFSTSSFAFLFEETPVEKAFNKLHALGEDLDPRDLNEIDRMFTISFDINKGGIYTDDPNAYFWVMEEEFFKNSKEEPIGTPYSLIYSEEVFGVVKQEVLPNIFKITKSESAHGSVDIYFIDVTGEIRGFSLPKGEFKNKQVVIASYNRVKVPIKQVAQGRFTVNDDDPIRNINNVVVIDARTFLE